jgi:photosystem II stability/assembly factor-like uncharacterized protein
MSPLLRLAPTIFAGLSLAGCSSPAAGPDARPIWPEAALPDRPRLEAAIPVRDCSPLALEAGATTPGWRVAEVAEVPLHDVACSKAHVFVAGEKATLLHRAPGGSLCKAFVKQKVPTSADLLTVAFADLSYGATAGRDPTIWETRDAGATWSVAPQCGDVVFSAFHAFHLHSATLGYGVGAASTGAAYKIFAGKTWICPAETHPGKVFHGVFRRENNGWIVGDTGGRIYHSPDDWFTWYFSDTGSIHPFRSVYFTPALTGVAVGDEGVIYRSVDGQGLDWSKVMTLGNDDLRDVSFVDESRGWAVGASGTILHTADGGQSWSYQPTPVTEELRAVCFTAPDEGWAVGAAGSILVTVSGGR